MALDPHISSAIIGPLIRGTRQRVALLLPTESPMIHFECSQCRMKFKAKLAVAVDCDSRREVAVKVTFDNKHPRQKARFVEEAEITARAIHWSSPCSDS